MNWHRIHYTGTAPSGLPVDGIIDVLAADEQEAMTSFGTYQAIRHDQVLVVREPIELLYLGESDGSKAVNRDPRTQDLQGQAETTIKAIKKHPGQHTRDP